MRPADRVLGATLLAAALFGASTPLAKLLVGEISPWMLAGLFYLGSGIGLSVYRPMQPCDSRRKHSRLRVQNRRGQYQPSFQHPELLVIV